MNAKSDAERQAGRKARLKEQGLKRYAVVIPDTPEAMEKLRKYAEKLCKQNES